MCGKSQFTIDDLHQLIFPADREVTGVLCMVYHCFLDDSKDRNQSTLYLSAGFFAEREQWQSLRGAWRKVLTEKQIAYFKSSEYNHLTDEFKRFRTSAYPPPLGRNAAKEIKDALQAVVKNHPFIRGLAIAIPVADYQKVCARPEAQKVFDGSPYHRALQSILFETVKMVRKRPGRNMVAFVHDEESDFDVLHAVYKGFRNANPKTAKFMGGFQPMSDKDHPELQMADMIANNMLEVGMDLMAKGQIDKARIAMRENVNLLGWWNEHCMLSVLKHNLVGKGHPIPLDLQADEYG